MTKCHNHNKYPSLNALKTLVNHITANTGYEHATNLHKHINKPTDTALWWNSWLFWYHYTIKEIKK